MEEILEKYIEAAKNQKDSEFYKVANKWHSELIKIYKQLKNNNDLQLLSQLLTYSHLGVRSWAATHYLVINEKVAKEVLQEIAKHGGMLGLSAEMVVKEWDNGNLKKYYWEL